MAKNGTKRTPRNCYGRGHYMSQIWENAEKVTVAIAKSKRGQKRARMALETSLDELEKVVTKRDAKLVRDIRAKLPERIKGFKAKDWKTAKKSVDALGDDLRELNRNVSRSCNFW
ncbi:MAG: hypothetical protein GTN93_19930 [Anaerolineae bacterium]|nr:hypothetical protein [Anaerolineae bacterium]